MRSEGVVGDDSALDEIRTLRLNTVIDVLAVIAERPAVKSAVAHRGHVIGDEIASQLIPLVHRDPQLPTLGFPGEAYRIAHAGCEHAMFAGRSIDFPDRRARLLVQISVFHRV